MIPRTLLTRGALAAVLPLALALHAAEPPAPSPGWNVTDHVVCKDVVVQSHRGAGELAEENTLEAFELGWRLGTYPESDVRTTSDGVIVTFHDNTFKRVVRNVTPELENKGVGDVTFSTLSSLEVGAWHGADFVAHRIPRLADVFVAMRGRPERHLYLDIKNVDLRQLAALVNESGVDRQVVLATSKPDTIREWKKLVPESDTLLWMRGGEKGLGKRIQALRQSDFSGITQLQIHIFPLASIQEALEIAGASPRQIEYSADQANPARGPYALPDAFIVGLGKELRARGILFQALPYTSDPSVYARLLDLGVASFATDHPDVTERELRRYYDRKASARPDTAR
ncbi:hypothetical protein DB347_16930 [Opitutaceae bacterium EW11]|nr:hypothetical protein DB347_16930 [Opitutaceae bacterium EW11]